MQGERETISPLASGSKGQHVSVDIDLTFLPIRERIQSLPDIDDAMDRIAEAGSKVRGVASCRMRAAWLAGRQVGRLRRPRGATAFCQEDQAATRAFWRETTDRLRETIPKVSTLMDEAENDVLAFMGFPNDASIVCLVSALLAEQTEGWQVNRRYMSLEAIRAVLRRDEQRAVIEHQAA